MILYDDYCRYHEEWGAGYATRLRFPFPVVNVRLVGVGSIMGPTPPEGIYQYP